MDNTNTLENGITKVCNKCGRILPIEKFRLVKGQFYNPYYLSQCKECEAKYQREYISKKKEVKFSDRLEILIKRQYKEIKPERILDISNIDIIPLGTDEIFVNLMDYKDIWLSNYGRVVRQYYGGYSLLQGSYDNNGALRYTVNKNVFYDGKWIYRREHIYAAKAVIEEFVVNPDKTNNVYIWHSGFDKQDHYYRNLYPLNQKQYQIVKNHFNKTGDDSEGFILKVMNDIRYKPDDWSRRCIEPVMCGVGYRGSENVDCTSESYLKWHDMLVRCYNEKFHERQPQYMGCTVCEEWLNYSNFKVWYDQHKIHGMALDLDKDILFKGNKVYSPETCCFVPHAINTLFLNCKKNRGDLPLGVHFDNDKGKYRAEMSFMGRQIKLGTFDTAEDAFARYKEYKEDFIQDMAEQYRDEIPNKVYEAMMSWKIEIVD
ncbi:hypothetical protein FMM75_23935 [Lachnospiraceae bacterium MD335]|nr:hypothetical protein [Lachnospiraceae bacterium MD335]